MSLQGTRDINPLRDKLAPEKHIDWPDVLWRDRWFLFAMALYAMNMIGWIVYFIWRAL